ncbi:hypothetical protein E8E13_006095 [Curvularia kusanoi]|uniref:Uncharacterized protein n=1 Tax=Curvularia kusanoi TaxID=90978 RepID=A0A9P4TAA2_CURKU|nr:hypothetical protein E8E13_006095 [Curvularia kusanoi]
MPSKNKMIVIVAFWLRMPTIVSTLLRNNATNSLTSTTNTSLTASMVSIWQTIEILNTGFGHGELIRVHGNTSQNYKLSDHNESSKGSKATNPSAARLNPASAIQQEPEQVTGSSRGEYQLQELDLRPGNVFQGTGISSSSSPKIVDLDKGHRRQYG